MNDQGLKRTSQPRRRGGIGRGGRAGAIALAALASLTVAVGCGGGDEGESAEPDLTVEQKLDEAGFQGVDSGDPQTYKIPGAPLPTEAYVAYDPEDPQSDNVASILIFDSVEDAEARADASTGAGSQTILDDGTLISVTDGIEQTPDSDAFLEQVTEVIEG